MNQRPSSYATMEAWLRQGSKEFTQALQAFPDSMQHVHEPGMLGSPTSQQVTEAMQGPEKAQPTASKEPVEQQKEGSVHGEKAPEMPVAEASVKEQPAAETAEKSDYAKRVEEHAARQQPQQESERQR